MKSKIQQYFLLEKEIKNYCGYIENEDGYKRDYKLFDNTEDVWQYNYNESCIYINGKKFFSNNIRQGEDYTLVLYDTLIDSNVYLGIFSNELRLQDES